MVEIPLKVFHRPVKIRPRLLSEGYVMNATAIREHYYKYTQAKEAWENMFEAEEAGMYNGVDKATEEKLLAEYKRYCRDFEDAYLWLEKNAPTLAKSLLTNSSTSSATS